jgi:2-C-methyl-D-erythritol 4-phosphate cytidylyltransferase
MYHIKNIKIDDERLQFTKKSLTNPNYLFVSLYFNSKYKVKFGILNNDINNTNNTNNHNKFKWTFLNNYIFNLEHKLYLTIYKYKLIVSRYKSKSQWDIETNFMKHKKTGLYISCDFEYNIVLSLDKSKAIHFNIENKYNYINLNFFKSDIRLKFEINNLKYNIKIHKFMLTIDHKIPNKLYNLNINTICILLSAGTSSRFQDTNIHNITSQYQYKQIHLIENKPLILYSIETIIDIVDKLIIITNIECYDKIKNIINENYNYQKDKKKKIILLINNINCRLESINTGLHYINKYYSKNNKNLNNIDNIIIHDVARPYITQDYIQKLISSENDNDNTTHLYSQYYLKLTNGLMNLDNNTIVDRNKYIELCTPLCINYNLFNFIFTNYIQKDNSITCEFIPILQLLNININLIEGHYKYLRKITTRDDI